MSCLQPVPPPHPSFYPLGLITTCSVPLLAFLALPTAAFSDVMAKRKVTTEELLAWAESNGYKRETALGTKRCI
jgi:hypothetical protein